jgi:hypothetical protein
LNHLIPKKEESSVSQPNLSDEVTIELTFDPPDRVPSILVARGTATVPGTGTFALLLNNAGVPIALSFATWEGNNYLAAFPSVSLPGIYSVRVVSSGWIVAKAITLPAPPAARTIGGDKPEVTIDQICCNPPGLAPTTVNVRGRLGQTATSVAVMILDASTEELVSCDSPTGLSRTWSASFPNISAGTYLLKVVDNNGSSVVQQFTVPCPGC